MIHIKLLFLNGKNKERLITNPNTKQEVVDEINKFLNERNLKNFYTRVWEENNKLNFDVGFHTEFFLL